MAPGDYRVKFPKLEDAKFSEKDSGVADNYDSDADQNGLTDIIHLQRGASVRNVDAGLKLPEPDVNGSIRGRFFIDEDCDTTQLDADTGMLEAGVAGAIVDLIPRYSRDPIDSVTTDANGNYHFENVPAGENYVVFNKPDAYEDKYGSVGKSPDGTPDSISSNATVGGYNTRFTLAEGQKITDYDAGIKQLRAIVKSGVSVKIMRRPDLGWLS